ncbi:hypothetical protein GC169_04000 [bacterium]|nr:hypothetical protein [bacterium]
MSEQDAKFEERLKDGHVSSRGWTVNGVPFGYWEWFRPDGTRLRSGHYANGEKVGEWITFNEKGEVETVTKLKPAG